MCNTPLTNGACCGYRRCACQPVALKQQNVETAVAKAKNGTH